MPSRHWPLPGLFALAPNAASAGPAGVLVTGRPTGESGAPAAEVTASRSTGRTVNCSNGIDATVLGSDLKPTYELESGESRKVTFTNTSTTLVGAA